MFLLNCLDSLLSLCQLNLTHRKHLTQWGAMLKQGTVSSAGIELDRQLSREINELIWQNVSWESSGQLRMSEALRTWECDIWTLRVTAWLQNVRPLLAKHLNHWSQGCLCTTRGKPCSIFCTKNCVIYWYVICYITKLYWIHWVVTLTHSV